MAWKITVDKLSIAGERSRVGVWRGDERLPMPHKWRTKDDDGEVYYEGVSSDSSSFGPLTFAQADAGATSIEYYNEDKKVWEPL